jgi:prolipoprotein diacylglyceryltransferase
MRDRLLRHLDLEHGDFLGHLLVPDQPVLSTLGGALAVLLATLWAHREGLVWWKALLTGGACALVGTGMGRVGWLLVDVDWSRIAANPFLIIDPNRGGAISFGALVGAVAGGFLALRLLRAKPWPYADILAPCGLIGIAFARIGCLMRSCCYGAPADVPWAMRYPMASNVYRRHYELDLVTHADTLSIPVHPFPLYLAAWCIACAIIGAVAPNLFGETPGMRALGVGMIWLAGRFCLEFFRHPGSAATVAGPFNIGQLFAALAIAAIAALFIWRRRSVPAN